ncbi:uncharacterized protein DDB_G0283357-like [Microplitis demolitor]|uniref:uncharacterized protein DDB_G0283357-like n=1 Tax=Microplitis demolitor TaxID=69319 RepID=UPI0004CD9F78|nr:uncharacterized protein DDB_G0283357-like [Microplitis demolitor]
MRVAGLYVFIFVVLVSCEPAPKLDPAEQPEQGQEENEQLEQVTNSTDADAEEIPDELKIDDLPGPLIILEYANENSTDEKSKRTIDNNLGYGYLKNNLFSGKYNYYYPNGKTGTTVSIEESITPFEPKTIIESDKPVAQKLEADWTANFPAGQQVFGQRTKLRKFNPSDYSHQQSYSTTARPNVAYTTIRPEYNQNAYTTPKPIFQNSYSSYSTTPTYNPEYVGGLHAPGSFETVTTVSPPLSSDPTIFNLPRFTVENGVRYENKIIWKYPDGRVVEPPMSFINSYSEYAEPQRTKVNHQNGYSNVAHEYREHNTGFRNPNGHQGASNIHAERNKNINSNNNIYSQRPATFPNDQDSLSQRPGAQSQSQAFNLSYQNNYSYRRGNGNTNNNNNNNNKERYEQRPYSKYAVDSSNPEYTPAPNNLPMRTTESPPILTQGGQLSSQVLNKYKPQVQQYLSKLFTGSKNKPYNSANFIENNYEQLLNYNPSISQYVKDPSSILQAYPTFIQSGKSLVPVIILRVDGVRPVEQQTPNINLKSLLQQYLTQYTSKPSHEPSQEFRPSPVDDLTYLTEALKRFSPNTQEQPSRLANYPLEYDSNVYNHKSSYDTINSETSLDNQRYKLTKKNGQKVKSVQIIDGPHYPN